jgi:hypothetical protein
MDEVDELIRRYGLGEDLEHVIIPLRDEKGRSSRCFLLKRRFLRIAHSDGHYTDFPLEEVIEAIMRHPSLRLSRALELLHRELDEQINRIFENHKEGTDH